MPKNTARALTIFLLLAHTGSAFSAFTVEKLQKRSNSRICDARSSGSEATRENAQTVLEQRGVGLEYCDPSLLVFDSRESLLSRVRGGIRGSESLSDDTCDSLYTLRSDGRTIFSVSKASYDAGIRRGDIVLEQDGVAFPDITNRRPSVNAGEITRLILGRAEVKVSAEVICPDSRANPQGIQVYTNMISAFTKPEYAQNCAREVLKGYVGGKFELWDFYICEMEALWHAAESREDFWAIFQPLIKQTAYESVDYYAGDSAGLESIEGHVTRWIRALSYGGDTRAGEDFESFWHQHKAAAESGGGKSAPPKLPLRALTAGKDCTFVDHNWAALFLGYGVAPAAPGARCAAILEDFEARSAWYERQATK